MELSYQNLKRIEKELGDSWYILDIDKFRRNYQDFSIAFKNIYPPLKYLILTKQIMSRLFVKALIMQEALLRLFQKWSMIWQLK